MQTADIRMHAHACCVAVSIGCTLNDLKLVEPGATNWVLTRKRALEDVPMWIAVMLNIFFIIFFEEHGPAAEVCLPSGRYFDFGHFGLPFFQHATWLMLLISILHGIFSGLRFYASVLERYPYHVYLERRQLVIQKEKEEHETAEVTIFDSTAIHAAALRSTATDGQIIFNGILLGSSLLGLIWTPFFFAIPLVDLMRTPTVKTLLGSVQHNADKLGQGALVGALLVYAHSILGYAFFRHQHQEGKCNNLFECSMNYLIGGMKGDSIDGVLQDLDIPGALWRDPDMWARIALDMSFYTIIPLVLLSIISGIIIDGFGELRDEMNEAKEYREATSVVCGVSRLTMEQFAPGSFDKHVQSAQNPYHYICLLLHLEFQDPSMDTWQEAFVRSQVRDRQTDFLPKGAALCLTHMEKDDRDKGNEMETTVTLLKALNIRVRSMEKDIRWMQAQQNIALRSIKSDMHARFQAGRFVQTRRQAQADIWLYSRVHAVQLFVSLAYRVGVLVFDEVRHMFVAVSVASFPVSACVAVSFLTAALLCPYLSQAAGCSRASTHGRKR
jgi:hypothetical protein